MRCLAGVSLTLIVGALSLGACSIDTHGELGDTEAEDGDSGASSGDGDGDDSLGESGEPDTEASSGDGDDETQQLGPCERDIGTCEDLQVAFAEETLAIRSCTKHTQCGQRLPGTSCGCRDWVARTGADATCFYELFDEAVESQCDVGLGGICDCPTPHGFLCVEGICTWKFTNDG